MSGSRNLEQKKRIVGVLAFFVCAYWFTALSSHKHPETKVPAQKAAAPTLDEGVRHAKARATPAPTEKAAAKEEHATQDEDMGKEGEVAHAAPTVRFTLDVAGKTREVLIEMDYDAAPKTAQNFVDLVKRGYYTGAVFYRSEPGFVVQGGGRDKHGHSKGQPFGPLKLEAKAANKRGTISMARTVCVQPFSLRPSPPPPHTHPPSLIYHTTTTKQQSVPDSASTEFFINLRDNGSLDPHKPGTGYTVFGRVTAGMDAIDKIATLATTKQGGLSMLKDPLEIGKAVMVE